MPQRRRLGEILLDAGLIDGLQLQAALANQRTWGGRLGTVLIKMGMITEEAMLKSLSGQLNIPTVDLSKIRISDNVLKAIPRDVVEKYHTIPVGLKKVVGRTTLYIALSDPTNFEAIDEIQFLTDHPVKVVLATDTAISDSIAYYYRGQKRPAESIEYSEPEGSSDEQMIIVKDGDETTQASAESKEVSSASIADKPEKMNGSRKGLMALLKLLIKKKIISQEEYFQELKNL
ncbi:MAG: hypothetical protein JSU92_06150 [Deltaproteobacteria bacterium]|nr:MAG: hypothetical protein JSU92_06150 [Deltaproteobacteria bacterium]